MWNNDRSNDSQFIKWARDVKIRDDFKCQVCGCRGIELNAHHENSWDAFPELRYNLKNGITLCVGCHKRFHEMYGWGQNTELQFIEYMLIAKLFIENILSKK